MENMLNSIKSLSLSVANYMTPVLKESSFSKTGYITPEEFVKAGDFLVHHCPTWRWSSAPLKLVEAYLPKDKQYLTTSNVPCMRRATDLRSAALKLAEEIDKLGYEKAKEDSSSRNVAEDFRLDDWVVNDFNVGNKDNKDLVLLDYDEFGDINDEIKFLIVDENGRSAPHSKSGAVTEAASNANGSEPAEDTEAPLDMDEYEKSGRTLSVDNSIVDFYSEQSSVEKVVVAERTYDLNITYDNYYRTPRFWFLGYDQERRPLTITQMYEDVSAEHANKTVTIERHPFLNPLYMASVHPCRHASLMKKLMSTAASHSNREVPVEWYLIIFLKFVQTVVPTIQYDFTRNCPF